MPAGPGPAVASGNIPAGLDPSGYYNPYDRNGYIDRNGRYNQYGQPPAAGAPPVSSGNAVVASAVPPASASVVYQEGAYENACYRGIRTAGTIFLARGGGIFGDPVLKGENGGLVGGVVLSGMLLTLGIDCEDQPYAFGIYANGLNGSVGRRLVWRHGRAFGEFTATSEFMRGEMMCRQFRERTYSGENGTVRNGTACLAEDGQWHFD